MKERMFKRNSRQRDTILEELRKVRNHPTAAVLYNTVRKRIPNISLGTVYRNLDQLAKKGIIQKLEISGGETRFDGDVDSHYHLTCTECGRVDDVLDLSYEEKKKEMAKIINGYQVGGYHMNFFGVCSECLGRNSNSNFNI